MGLLSTFISTCSACYPWLYLISFAYILYSLQLLDVCSWKRGLVLWCPCVDSSCGKKWNIVNKSKCTQGNDWGYLVIILAHFWLKKLELLVVNFTHRNRLSSYSTLLSLYVYVTLSWILSPGRAHWRKLSPGKTIRMISDLKGQSKFSIRLQLKGSAACPV